MINLKKYLYVIIGVIFGTVVIVLISYKPTPKAIQKLPSSPVPTNEVTNMGIIEGSMGFPSEVIPEDVIVCAENQETKKEYCTEERLDSIKYTYRVGYKLEVPEGEYLVYEKMKKGNYRAYYTEFVTCGFTADCTSHEPIIVSVAANEKVDEIDPQDWYNQLTPAP
ncbi:hypothetical protein A2685_03120 [Candidatus Woesebacteria bacterium RIFCSPHIGHO2_01_FULL_37_10]|uniref:Uncharacterized protein n=1 Tax=Candidatus Woesebacteria bacterium RIFCSPHIGHO2_01_FULL_37_10 TaxID=1802489 RepID=A0A1F7XTN2_9BACT|nr:MAG: hypothetical protein A2685_03120 [Candidatus Woesebacteria bacterium RIFCSPHIGHO2_01_FULL_37_10]